MGNILQKIIENKQKELLKTKKDMPLNKLYATAKSNMHIIRDFKTAISTNKINLIAEIKKASPSKGNLCSDMDIEKYAKLYESSGAAAISVLTENKFFKGNIHYLKKISTLVNIPILRKDFIIDPYQIFESKFYGADAILLIAAILNDNTLTEFLSVCKTLKLAALVEVHNQEELERVLNTDAEIIGINNRDLETFEIDLKTTKNLAAMIPNDKIIVSESGIFTKDHVDFVKRERANAILVGEAIVKNKNPEIKIKELLS